jgi:hypothetical protein
MKTTAFQTACLVFASLSLLAMTGCNDRRDAPGQTTQNMNTKEDPALKDLETKAGISFPTNTVLVNFGDGGGRDASHGFYEWAVFSPSPIKMPVMQATGVKDYLSLPLDDTVKFVQSRMGKRKIEQPQAALSSDWQTNGFAFGGTLIRSPKGDYLVIQRGRIK